METTDTRIIEIANKYQPIIEKEFSDYVDFSKFDDLKTNIFLKNHHDFVELYGNENASAFFNEKKRSHLY